MTRAVTLVFVLIGSIVERSSAVSCYSCKERTCPDPFRAASVPTCNGAVCELLYRVAYSPSSGEQLYSFASRNCSVFADLPLLDHCLMNPEQYNSDKYTYFTDGSRCCFTDIVSIGATKMQYFTCLCKEDNCNGDRPQQIPTAGNLQSTTAYRIPSNGDQQLTRANRISSAVFSPQPISKLSIVFVAIVAFLSLII